MNTNKQDLLLRDAITALDELVNAIESKDAILACDSAGSSLSRMQCVNRLIFAKQRARELVAAACLNSTPS